MEPLWSPVVATAGNQRQIGWPSKPEKQAESVATGCHRLPETFHGSQVQQMLRTRALLRQRSKTERCVLSVPPSLADCSSSEDATQANSQQSQEARRYPRCRRASIQACWDVVVPGFGTRAREPTNEGQFQEVACPSSGPTRAWRASIDRACHPRDQDYFVCSAVPVADERQVVTDWIRRVQSLGDFGCRPSAHQGSPASAADRGRFR
jgi:hypothetical protein